MEDLCSGKSSASLTRKEYVRRKVNLAHERGQVVLFMGRGEKVGVGRGRGLPTDYAAAGLSTRPAAVGSSSAGMNDDRMAP